ncbi:MAG TPA: DUF2339 domain-containing protein [Candidatus Gracilibacteria bacterium]
MDEWEILIILAVCGVFILPIILIIWNISQGTRIKELEDYVYSKKAIKTAEKEAHGERLEVYELQKSSAPQPKVATKKVPPSPQKEFHWEEFFTKKFFGILGALSVVLAIGFFGVWAFAHGWIGPMGRIAVGILVSLILLVGGELTRESYPKYFAYLSSAGIAGLIITTFVARNVYGFLDPMQAFSGYVIEVVVGVFLSLRYNSRILGNFSIIAGLIAPALVQSDPNEIGLLAYLAVLTIGGFTLSLKQKWPEILALLFLGICTYEGVIFNLVRVDYQGDMVPTRTGFAVEQSWVFLSFILGMHWLLGLGGIFRSVREKLTQTWEQKAEVVTVFEMILMIVSIVAANGMASTIFQWHDWPYLGFFLLAQGFALFFLSEYLKKSDLSYFQRIAISGTLITVILATILEIGATNREWVTIALLLEGVLMVWAVGELKDKWIGLFGRLTLFLGSFYGLGLPVWWAALGIILYGLGNGIGIKQSEKPWERNLSIAGVIWFVFLVLGWNFDALAGLINTRSEQLVFLFVIPTVLSSGLAYSIIKSRNVWSTGLGLGSMISATLMASGVLLRMGSLLHREPIGLTVLLFMLIGYFTVLSTAFLEDDGAYFVSKEARTVITRIVLSATTLLTLVVGAEIFSEPLMTIFWIVWGIILLVAGTRNNWPTFRYFGIGTLLLVIAKLYLIDVWGWDTGQKVIAFSVLGIVLLGLSFYAQKKK